ncbi:hypothetical protein AAG570_004735 [Ranatra chinensis]|uniref:Uncharacterized protein n=1 Tax=Ranatra chinensis TaxID=642074 RepID=A0ABD0YJV9_9HEMI
MASKRRKMFQKNKTQETTENASMAFYVRSFHILPSFKGSLRNYDDSLAVATVETPFALSSFTLPVCLDWTPWVHVKTGKVITYKVTAPDSSSSSIVFENQSYDLDLVDYNECIDNVPRNFVKFVGSGRLCATRPDGVDVISQGSIGNAFTVVKEGRHVFYGMVVLKPRDVGVNILLMENVSMYRQFIADNVPDISRMHETQVILNVEW